MSVAETTNWTVLLVDDSPADRKIAAHFINSLRGMTVIEANDGEEALELLERERPDLVVTDVAMPRVDGLALTKSICDKFPEIPTIIMTAVGSEELAVAALKAGASHYVPKRNLKGDLPRTCADVLAILKAQRTQQELASFWVGTRSSFVLPNDVSLIPAVVNHARNIMPGGAERQFDHRVGLALHEALMNAIHHGNLELDSQLREDDDSAYYQLAEERRSLPPYCDRQVYVDLQETQTERRYVIRDEGNGFDPSALHFDPEDPEHLLRNHGRGLLLIRMFVDRVTFNDIGNRITLVQKKEPVEAREAVAG